MTSLDLHLALQAKLDSSAKKNTKTLAPTQAFAPTFSMAEILDPVCLELRRKFDKAMHERVNSEGALYDLGALGRWLRFDRAKLEWEMAIDMMVEHRRTCRDCPRRISAKMQNSA